MDEYKGYRYVPYINKPSGPAPAVVDVWYYPPQGDPASPRHLASFRASTEADAVAQAERAFRDWVDSAQSERMARAKANIEADLQQAGLTGWSVQVERLRVGNRITLKIGSRSFTREGIAEAILEDGWSPARRSLIRQAKHELEPRN